MKKVDKTIKPRNNIVRAMIKMRKYGGAHLDHHKEDLEKAKAKDSMKELMEDKC